MSNLKDTDIDDLFRRASDKYPLRTDSANWDRMAAALEKEPPAPPDIVDAEEKRKKRRFFWLFLLLPLAGAGYYAMHHTGTTGDVVKANYAVTDAGTVTTQPSTASATGETTPATSTTGQGTPATETTTGTTAIRNTDPNTTATTGNRNVTSNATARGQNETATGSQDDVEKQTPATASTALSNRDRTSSAGLTRNQPNHSLVHRHTNATEEQQSGTENIGGQTSGTENSNNENNGSENFASRNIALKNAPADRLFYDLQRAPIPHDYRLAVNVTAPAAKKDTTAKPRTPNKTKHFYAGVFGSPDLSTVKMQSVKGVGSTFGIMLGYTFNGGHWAIETGAYVDRKKYYTDGEYFNTKEVRIPSSAYLTDVNGICYMWEIPLNVRYNFNPGAKTSWFATAGFSTYLMSHEKYAYGLEWNGSNAVYDSTWNIHKPSQYPFSIINLSAGFEQRLGKIGNLRVEPYVRLPLTGLGTGKLPIMSAGVNIGITRQLW